MKMAFKSIIVTACTCLMASSFNSNAALVERLGGQAVYDTDLDITWLADANYSKTSGHDSNGRMSWDDASAWATSLTIGGFTDWRLPTTLNPDPTCATPETSRGSNCSGSELGHLFYTELGATWLTSFLDTGDPAGLALFTNLDYDTLYWSSTEFSDTEAWFFDTNIGGQNTVGKTSDAPFAWAVRSGDVSAVPVPTAAWLFGSGLLGLVSVARRKKYKILIEAI
jgi:hypothetical protein